MLLLSGTILKQNKLKMIEKNRATLYHNVINFKSGVSPFEGKVNGVLAQSLD